MREYPPVEHGTRTMYCNYECRCDECRAANNEYAKMIRSKPGRTQDSMRARSIAKTKAQTWVIVNHPETWQQILDEAYAEVGTERRPVGRPRKGAT